MRAWEWEEEPETQVMRRDAVRAGMVVHSSHGYRMLITETQDLAKVRTDDRHVGFGGYIVTAHGPGLRVAERYPAGSEIVVEVASLPSV